MSKKLLYEKLSSGMVGFIFAIGLGVARMTQPQKVVGFLDFFGNWDPSLMFVMVGAIAIHFLAFRWILKRPHPLFTRTWALPEKQKVTKSLVIGSVLFGVGWGLAGYCPGPALVSVVSFRGSAIIFVGGMVLGMYLFKVLDRKMKFNR